MTVLAHTGHWANSLIYLAPVLLLAGALAVQRWREGPYDDARPTDDEDDFADLFPRDAGEPRR